jgi:uncharacterized membrane protein YjfL (UPF0719 family)
MHPVSTRTTALFGVLTALTLLALLRAGRALVSRTAKDEGARRNAAQNITLGGDVLAVLLVAAATVRYNALGQSVAHDVISVAIMGVTGLALVQISGSLGVRALFGGHLRQELARANVAAGLAAGAHYASMGVLARHAVSAQDWRSWGLSLVFFTLAVLAHLGAVSLFRALTTYDDDEHIRGGNLAAALSYAGVSVASAVVISRALEGDFTTWKASLTGFALLSACVLGLYPVRQLVVQSLWLKAPPTLRGGALDDAIAQDRDVGAAALEATTYLASALALVALA